MAFSVSDTVSSASSRLNAAYSRGAIVYPRVFNDYNDAREFVFFPHPPIPQFDEFSVPLRYSKYPLIIDAIPVELSNENIATAATLEGIVSWLDKYYTYDMQPRTPKLEKEIEEKVSKMYSHLSRLSKEYGDPVSMRGKDGKFDVNRIAKDGVAARFKMEIMPFRIRLKPSPEVRREIIAAKRAQRKKKRGNDIDSFVGLREKIVDVKKFEEAIAMYAKKTYGVLYLRRKADRLAKKRLLAKMLEKQVASKNKSKGG